MTENNLDLNLVNKNFSRAVSSYDNACALQDKVLNELLEYLKSNTININRKSILDIGCGTGSAIDTISKHYPQAQIISADQSQAMVQKACEHTRKKSRINFIAADTFALPFAPLSFDLVFSNLMLQWCFPLEKALGQINQTLNSSGEFIFSSLIKPTFYELKKAWGEADNYTHVNDFLTDKQIYLALQKAGFSKIKLTTKRITMHYENVGKLIRDLKNIGAVNSSKTRRRGLTSVSRFKAMEKAYEKFREKNYLPATYQVIYGIVSK